jgi:hypothetical protein
MDTGFLDFVRLSVGRRRLDETNARFLKREVDRAIDDLSCKP